MRRQSMPYKTESNPSMRIWTISDLHLRPNEAISMVTPETIPDADVCVLAGDVCDSLSLSVNWAGKVIRPHMPVVYVLGNHEFYDTSIEFGRKNARMLADSLRVTLLDDSSAVIDGVRFVGGTLWSDFEIFATGEGEERAAQVAKYMYQTRHGMADFGNIYLGAVEADIMPRLVRPADLAKLHRRTVSYLEAEMAKPHAGATVVVTHHAPHPSSIHPRFANDPVTSGFVSDLSALIERAQPDLWVHGHVHQSFDYTVGKTRIACNPRGYKAENASEFAFGKVIELEGEPAPRP